MGKLSILWFYKHFKQYNFDHWLHMDFAEALKNTDGIELLAYGHDLKEGYPDLAPIEYNPKLTMEDLKKEFDYDIVILNTKSRMFLNYLPPRKYNDRRVGVEIREGCWLPEDFKTFTKTPKIVIEEDFHWEESDDWYVGMGIDRILQRHYMQSLRSIRTPAYWFPFSVDINSFKPNPNIIRKNKLCFVGCDAPDCYPHRAFTSNLLKEVGLLKRMGSLGIKKVGDEYIKTLQSYVSHLSGSSAVDISAAKMFEIMASGSLLFTNESDRYGLKDLFPRDCYCTYKEDYSDVIEKAKKIINDGAYVKETVEKGLQCVRERHSHKVRITELLKLLKREFGI